MPHILRVCENFWGICRGLQVPSKSLHVCWLLNAAQPAQPTVSLVLKHNQFRVSLVTGKETCQPQATTVWEKSHLVTPFLRKLLFFPVFLESRQRGSLISQYEFKVLLTYSNSLHVSDVLLFWVNYTLKSAKRVCEQGKRVYQKLDWRGLSGIVELDSV